MFCVSVEESRACLKRLSSLNRMKLVRDFSQEGIGIQLIDENCQIYLQEREEAYQRELEAARIEKEKEIARLRAQQERAKDKQAEKVL